jgi:hypothetical protein
MHAAEEALTAALQDGQHKYEAGDWLAHSMEDHLDHAGAHLEELLNTEELTEEKLRTGLSHLICRAVMPSAARRVESNAARFSKIVVEGAQAPHQQQVGRGESKDDGLSVRAKRGINDHLTAFSAKARSELRRAPRRSYAARNTKLTAQERAPLQA